MDTFPNPQGSQAESPQPLHPNFKKVRDLVIELVRHGDAQPLFGDEAIDEHIGLQRTIDKENQLIAAVYDSTQVDKVSEEISREVGIPLKVIGHIQATTPESERDEDTVIYYLLEDGNIYSKLERTGKYAIQGSSETRKIAASGYIDPEAAGAVFEVLDHASGHQP